MLLEISMICRTTMFASLAFVAALPLAAHHSFEAQFDSKKPVTIKGKVTKVDWMNPHIYLHVDGVDDKGVAAQWDCEGGNPNSLRRNGWTKFTIKAGDEITIDGTRAKDGTNTCNARSVKLADGTRVLAGSSEGAVATKKD
jgi:hypothetical protein